MLELAAYKILRLTLARAEKKFLTLKMMYKGLLLISMKSSDIKCDVLY